MNPAVPGIGGFGVGSANGDAGKGAGAEEVKGAGERAVGGPELSEKGCVVEVERGEVVVLLFAAGGGDWNAKIIGSGKSQARYSAHAVGVATPNAESEYTLRCWDKARHS